MLKFLKSPPVMAATLLIVLQGALIYSAVRPEAIPAGRPLSMLPAALGSWKLLQEGVIDDDTRNVLKADDLLNRFYGSGTQGANLFVAAFRSQRNGKTPHSPKNCLPGTGWTPLNSTQVSIDVGRAMPIVVNQYVVAHGDDRSLVLYWYQSRDRAIASEYTAKFWVVVDAMRLNRTDTALVRVVVPIVNRDEDAAAKSATDFVKAFYGTLREYLPS
ncbi:MAG TPA: EpsI family protein [Bryobacteraceae bacterium]|nr:EpsI family protein [Bryobacteraceae bacterium]